MRYNEFIEKLEKYTGEKFTYYKIAKLTGENFGTVYKRKVRNSKVTHVDVDFFEKMFNINLSD